MTDKSHEELFMPDGEVSAIDTDYQVGQDNIALKIGPVGLDIHNRVFVVSGTMVAIFLVITLAFSHAVGPLFAELRDLLTAKLDWFFFSANNLIVLLCIGLVLSPLGKVRIGGTTAKPDYGYIAWFSMLFAAGMGIGLMFYGVAEPLSHYASSLAGTQEAAGVRTDWAPLAGAEGDHQAAKDLGMAATIFHWGLHPWAVYSLLALSLAIFSFNKGLPLTMRSILYPLFGERVWGWPGHIIDITAVVATLFGLATSLGYGASQVNAGLHFLFDLPENVTIKIVLIVVITGLSLASVVAGLEAGIKRLSEFNMLMALLLLLFVMIAGPSLVIFNDFFANIAAYFKNFIPLSSPFDRADSNYSQGWTAFYWAWWMSWSPFVGMFIARVSRGRSVREFVVCVMLIPSTVCILWMTTFGGTAIELFNQGYQVVAQAELPLQLFKMLEALPYASVTSMVGMCLVVIFFVTSSDSGSLVIDTISAGGKVDAPIPQRVFWCVAVGLVAISLLLGGGLSSLQAMVVSTGFPFCIVLLLCGFSLLKGLMSEPRG